MIYILSRIVDKLFFACGIIPIDQHLDLAFFGPDHHRLIAQAAHHVKRVPGLAAKRKLQSVFFHPLFKGRFKRVLDLEEPVGRAQPSDALMRSLVIVVFDPKRRALDRVFKTGKLGALQKLV